jgi:hypothetical protein
MSLGGDVVHVPPLSSLIQEGICVKERGYVAVDCEICPARSICTKDRTKMNAVQSKHGASECMDVT